MVRRLAYSVSEREHLISAAGGLVGILAVLWVGHFWLDGHGGMLAIASMGASAVLLDDLQRIYALALEGAPRPAAEAASQPAEALR